MERRISWWLLGIGVFLGVSLLSGGGSVAAKDGVYEVVSPLGKSTVKIVPPSPRLSSLEGKKIGFVWNVFENGDTLANALADLLGKRFKHIESVKLPSGKGLKWGSYPEPSIKDVIKEAKVDALISTVGG
jgi:hypothetical protein